MGLVSSLVLRQGRRESAVSPQRVSPNIPPDGSSSHRVVVKAGTTLLTNGTGGLDGDVIPALVEQIAALHKLGMEVALVSSGAVAAGRHVLGSPKERRDVPFRQVLAAVGQSRLMHTYEDLFRAHDITVAQALLSRRDLTDRLGYLNVRNTLLALLERRVIPIVNENDVVAVEELTGEAFGDNDNLSAMVANLVDADLLVMLGTVEGLFTADPHLDDGAELIEEVERLDERIEPLGGPSWENQGRGGMSTKLEAAALATASGVRVVIASGTEPGVLTRVVSGERVGTLFRATGNKMESRKRWMLSGLSTRGEIVVDEGAVRALRDQNRSLLPAGVVGVTGSFQRGDIISILDSTSRQVTCGVTNYGSRELTKIKGMRSDRVQEVLGYHYGDEVVHRSNMVVL